MDLEPLFTTMNISKSGLIAQRKRLDVIAQNLANIETTRTAEGGPYRRQVVSLEEGKTPASSESEANSEGRKFGGVLAKIREDTSPFSEVYDPSHPDADSEGFVHYPNVDIVSEMTELISATRAFEANVTAFNAAKQMMRKALEL
ncbi:MAG: flagellar basal body rod protein FlgC [bacterium]